MKKYIIYLLTVTVGLVSLNSCDEMNSFHEPYLEEGPIVYRAKPDSLYVYSGDERVAVNWELSIDEGIVKTLITIDDENTQEFPIVRQNDVDVFTEIIESLTEGNHKITIVNQDVNGNSSLPISTFVDVFGETYRSGLETRKIGSTTKQPSSLSIEFGVSKELERTSEFSYFDATTGEEIVVVTQQEDESVLLENVDFTKLVQYRTFYVPNDNSIDEFPSDWVEYSVEIEEVVNSIVLRPILGGMAVDWSNPANLDISVDVVYSKDGVETTSVFNSNSSQDTGVTVLDELGVYDVSVIIFDDKNNGIFTASLVEVLELSVKLDNSAWAIHDESLSRPDFPVTNMIDGNYATFWHTPNAASVSPTGETPPYPHWFIVDLGSLKTVVSYKLFRRVNNGTGPTAHEIWVSADDVTYTKVATYNSSIPNNNGILLGTDEELVRYVKYIATSGPNFFTHMGEIEVYGRE